MSILYPSAKHDRFSHSIGTYHLGQKAFDGFFTNAAPLIFENISNLSPQKFLQQRRDNYRDSFLLACLLHDVGHAPFSHTCEDLYCYKSPKSGQLSELEEDLLDKIMNFDISYFSQSEKNEFEADFRHFFGNNSKDIKDKDKDKDLHPAPHETMSALIILEKYDLFKKCFTDSGQTKSPLLDFIIRAILGCTYGVSHKDSPECVLDKGIRNCLILLLNSKTVDVDKLDYIARDSLMSGYQNVVLDNERLLSSLCYVKKTEGDYVPAFNKSALSVLNNVIAAKNSQAKWIFNHPITVYDHYLLNRCIVTVLKHLAVNGSHVSFDEIKKQMFDLSTLSKEGNKITTECRIMLLSDADIIYLIKQVLSSGNGAGDTEGAVEEFLNRGARRSPVWKSKEEYCYSLYDNTDKDNKIRRQISDFFMPLITNVTGVEDLSHSQVINEAYYNEIMSKKDTIYGADLLLNILNCLKDFCGDQYIFDFVFLIPKVNYQNAIDNKIIENIYQPYLF
ncbi:hypothetical protein SDC9_115374 [bioreactor metagenome]|uniref:HD/PDEase domain-containing protein n=1 Tax=bioreactor metagenome TaxID=1076179 RepID=A0A645BUZ6_9ZZZZ